MQHPPMRLFIAETWAGSVSTPCFAAITKIREVKAT